MEKKLKLKQPNKEFYEFMQFRKKMPADGCKDYHTITEEWNREHPDHKIVPYSFKSIPHFEKKLLSYENSSGTSSIDEDTAELHKFLVNTLSETDIMGKECNSLLDDIGNLLDENLKESKLNLTISLKILEALTKGTDYAYFEGFKKGVRLFRTMSLF